MIKQIDTHALSSLLINFALNVIDLIYVLSGYLEPIHEELSDFVDVFPLYLHLHALVSALIGYIHSAASCTFHT